MTVFKLPAPEDDGLLIPTVGDWAADKHHFLRRYMHAFTQAMKGKAWSALHYIDLFAGPGILRLESSGRLEWGSPLIAAQMSPPFHSIHLCELNPQYFAALQARLDRINSKPKVYAFNRDANEFIDRIMKDVLPGSLSVAFLDPYGLHLDYETLRALAARKTDLIIFFPDRVDALRNWEHNYLDDPDSNLDRALGPGADWRSIKTSFPQDQWANELRKLYVSQIKKLGYTQFEFERIFARRHPLYLLTFCSRHPAGAKIWRGVARMKRDGQRLFDFGSPDEPGQ